jgi:hypothetical protein
MNITPKDLVMIYFIITLLLIFNKVVFIAVAVEPVVEEGCKSDNECPTHQACINRQCRDPCNCGVNADCKVTNHRPICRCRPGYEGNPQISCQLGKLKRKKSINIKQIY